MRAWLVELSDKPSGRQRKPRDGEETPEPATLSARTVGYCHAILRKALNDAMRDELLARNVAELVETPKVRRRKFKPLTEEEATTLIAAAANHRLRALWLLMLGTGLRKGEALAVRWEDVDLDAGTLSVEHNLQRLRGEVDRKTGRRRGRLVEKETKTEDSEATIALPLSGSGVGRHERGEPLALL